ncbi:MAG: transposase [Gracilibacteraceae bacterium]|jgi:hypothetical protein|nr:transposase [Gracilibacteraceae bacterium]
MNAIFEYTTNLQYKVKSLLARVQAFESGEKYTSMKSAFKTQLDGRDREIRGLKSELADARSQLVTMRNHWQQVFDDLEKEHAKELRQKDRKTKELEERALKAEGQRDDFRARLKEKSQELYQVKTELEESQGRNQKLTAQIHRDYENSSTPSSRKPNHKKITNNRVKTEKKPGGQPGHKGHERKPLTPTNRIPIPAPEKYLNRSDFKPTGRLITKQVINIRIQTIVDEYSTPEFRNVHTGQRVHAEFPKGMVNEVNYGGSVKALAYLLNNHCNVSLEKVSDLLAELSGGELELSTGMINGLSGEFSRKTEADQKKAFADILLSPVMNLDFTSVRVNGKNANVLVCATPTTVLYFAREHKGHKGVKGTPVEGYQHAMIHDHDPTFYKYGSAHQECLEHVLRYLKNSMENEPGLKWNKQMRKLIRAMIHFWNGLDPGGRNPDEVDPEKVKAFEVRYDEILELAREEYEYEPPNKYYKQGFNLFKKLLKYRDNHLLFLHDIRVSPTNNLAERLLRVFKRKLAQVMSFRSFESVDDLCRSMGTVASLRTQNLSLFESIAQIFDRSECGKSDRIG